MSKSLPLEERKQLLPKIFAAFCIAHEHGDGIGETDYLLTERFLGVIGRRAGVLKQKGHHAGGLVEWFLTQNILDDFWEQVERLGVQDKTLGVITFYKDFSRAHRVFLAECEKKVPALVRLVKRTFESREIREYTAA